MKTGMVIIVLTCLAIWLPAQDIQVIAPNGNESWVRNTTQPITWKYSGISDKTRVNLVLFKDGTGPANKLGNIVQKIPIGKDGLGSYSWNVGNYEGGVAPDGIRCYFVRVITMDRAQRDESDNPFSISSGVALAPINPAASQVVVVPGIIIDRPNSSDQWLEGDVHEITWIWVGISRGDPNYPAEVSILLYIEEDHGRGVLVDRNIGIISAGTPNTGSFRWVTHNTMYGSLVDIPVFHIVINAHFPPPQATLVGKSAGFWIRRRS